MIQPEILDVNALRSRKIQTVSWKVRKPNKSTPESLRCNENFYQYMKESSLHCFKYAGNRRLSTFERVFFTVSLLLVFLLSIYFIFQVWVKWNESPIIVSLSSVSTSVSDIPFPAVTVCNMNKARKSVVENFPEDSVEFALVQSLCFQRFDNSTKARKAKWRQYRNVLFTAPQQCKDMFVVCKYGNTDYDCGKLFNNILTDDGMCCIFNGVHTHFILKEGFNRSVNLETNDDYLSGRALDYDPERGFSKSKEDRTARAYPRTWLGTGYNLGLSVVLNVGIEEYYCGPHISYGFRILLHAPHEYPKIAQFGVTVANGYETFITVSPMLTVASDNVRHISSKIRRCYFVNENFLSLYRTYSQSNCQMECESKIYAHHCNCILYYMPGITENVTICGLSDFFCILHVEQEIGLRRNQSFMCKRDCLPGCFEISYNSAVSMAPIIPDAQVIKENNISPENVAIVHIFSHHNYFRSQKIDELIDFTAFLSNSGGLLGLFLGFSFLSIVELAYFISLKPYYDHVRYYQSHRKAIQQILRKVQRTFGFEEKSTPRIKIDKIHENRKRYPYLD